MNLRDLIDPRRIPMLPSAAFRVRSLTSRDRFCQPSLLQRIIDLGDSESRQTVYFFVYHESNRRYRDVKQVDQAKQVPDLLRWGRGIRRHVPDGIMKSLKRGDPCIVLSAD